VGFVGKLRNPLTTRAIPECFCGEGPHEEMLYQVSLGCVECMRCRLLLPMVAVSVCQSVCHAAQLGFTVQKWLERIKMLFGVNTPGGSWNIALDRLDSLTAMEVNSILPLPNYFGLLFSLRVLFTVCRCI